MLLEQYIKDHNELFSRMLLLEPFEDTIFAIRQDKDTQRMFSVLSQNINTIPQEMFDKYIKGTSFGALFVTIIDAKELDTEILTKQVVLKFQDAKGYGVHELLHANILAGILFTRFVRRSSFRTTLEQVEKNANKERRLAIYNTLHSPFIYRFARNNAQEHPNINIVTTFLDIGALHVGEIFYRYLYSRWFDHNYETIFKKTMDTYNTVLNYIDYITTTYPNDLNVCILQDAKRVDKTWETEKALHTYSLVKKAVLETEAIILDKYDVLTADKRIKDEIVIKRPYEYGKYQILVLKKK